MTINPFETIAVAVRQLLPLGGVTPSSAPTSPIAAWRWNGSPLPQVFLDGNWAPLLAVDDVSAERLVEQAVMLGRRDWQRMLVAEFGAVAAAAGLPATGEYRIARAGMAELTVEASAQNLVTSIHYFLLGDPEDEMAGAEAALADFAHLAAPTEPLDAARIGLDLDVLERLVRRDFSYWDHVPGEWQSRLHALRAAQPASRMEHVERLRDLMVLLGDGHTRVDSADPDLLRRGVLPVQIDWVNEAPIAVTLERSALFDADHPFIIAMGGVPIREWMRAARRAVPRGTVAMRRNWMARELRRAGAVAPLVGATLDGLRIAVTLGDASGTARTEHWLDLIATDPRVPVKPVDSRWLAGNVGYLALRGQMTSDPAALAEAHAAMRHFAPAKGLVIDIRDNGGGSRDLLRAVAGYLLAPDQAVVSSWARLRRDPGADPANVEEVLQGRYMRPWNWAGWSPAAKAAAAAFEARHMPEWPDPEDARFGPLNLLMLERLPEQGDLQLRCPVVVLTNIRNYSASDIFASSLAAIPGVVLLGTPTAGGSGFARRTVLPGSLTTIQISTMASGMVDGDLYENHGVVPEEILWPSLEQWRQELEGDPLVIRALERIAQAAGAKPGSTAITQGRVSNEA
ncbi:MAG: hypothetical protein ABS76_13130 [Pelagibacterium sp. SCN 64-44]|nr:MAG: hypothetical protein ABS76_13130 [Pelagibacterium sp. SCN 64-44]